MSRSKKTYREDELELIKKALDEVVTKYEANHDYIFEHESDRQSFLYSFGGLFPKKRRCVIPRCNNKSIRSSHSIQKAHSLKIIAENNHIYSPKFNKKIGKLEMVKVGVNQASTFPGFCPKHERLFHPFENIKDVDSNESVQWQIFRTISRELVVKHCQLEKLIKIKDRYLNFREKKISKLFYATASQKISSMSFPRSVSIDFEDKYLLLMDSEINKVSSDICFLTSNFFDPLYKYMLLKESSSCPLYIFKIMVSEKIPVALAGRGSFHIKRSGIQDEISTILNILPIVDSTLLYIAVELKNKEFLEYYISLFQHTGLPGLNLAETWMVRGSDHWFIKPSVWDELEDARKEQVLKDVLDVSYHIAEVYEHSIFDSLRKKSLDAFRNDQISADPEIQKKIDFELNKFGSY